MPMYSLIGGLFMKVFSLCIVLWGVVSLSAAPYLPQEPRIIAIPFSHGMALLGSVCIALGLFLAGTTWFMQFAKKFERQ